MQEALEANTITKKKSKLQPKWKNAPRYADLVADKDSAESSMSEYRYKLNKFCR